MEDKVPVWEKANLSLEEAAAYFGRTEEVPLYH